MQGEREERTAAAPLGRAGEAHDLAPSVLFFSSDGFGWSTGGDLVVDRGVMTGSPWCIRAPSLTERSPITIYQPVGR